MRPMKSNEDTHGMFDTLQFSKRAEKAGYTKNQAEFQATELSKIINDNLATKGDIKGLSHQIDLIKKDIIAIEHRMTIKMGSMMVIVIGLLYTLLKFT